MLTKLSHVESIRNIRSDTQATVSWFFIVVVGKHSVFHDKLWW